jgi:UDP-glucose:(heptosyl)LPS alpha-1,3-glucosyltransferase
MKIALVISDYDSQGGGAERWTDRHARRLLAAGHAVHLFARRFHAPPAEAVCHPMEVPRYCRKPRLEFAARAEQLLRQERFDCIHDMGDGWFCDVFMPHHGTRRGGFQSNTRLVKPWLRWARSLAVGVLPRYREFDELERRQFDRDQDRVFVALSCMVREHMLKFYDIPADRIRVIYNGVDTTKFRCPRDESQRDRARRAFGLGETTVFLIVAHNFRLKGVRWAIEALARVCRSERSADLLVVGGDHSTPYRRLARRLGCGRHVRFVGNQPDPLACYHAADAYVHPTYYDPCSLVVLEALACGLPVVTTRQNGAGELLNHGTNGFIVDHPENVPMLTEYMGQLTDAALRSSMAVSARRLAEQHSLEHNSTQLVQLYEELGAQRNGRCATSNLPSQSRPAELSPRR